MPSLQNKKATVFIKNLDFTKWGSFDFKNLKKSLILILDFCEIKEEILARLKIPELEIITK